MDRHSIMAAIMQTHSEWMVSKLNPRTLEDFRDMLGNAAMGLAGESGEIADTIKKVLYQGKHLNDDTREHILEEMGDALFYLTMVAYIMDCTMLDVFSALHAKLDIRYPSGFTVQASDNRERDDELIMYAMGNILTDAQARKKCKPFDSTGSVMLSDDAIAVTANVSIRPRGPIFKVTPIGDDAVRIEREP